jgi:hypothetical protein
MKLFLVASAALLATTAAASAEAFTFTSKGTLTSQVCTDRAAANWFVDSSRSRRNDVGFGKENNNKGTCGTWSAPPGGGMTNTGACAISTPTAAFRPRSVVLRWTTRTRRQLLGGLTGVGQVSRQDRHIVGA